MSVKTRSDRRTLSSSLSAEVLRWLISRGHSQAEVARMLKVSEPFISLVKSRERSFTLDHMNLLAEAMNVPLGALLLQVTERDAKTPESRAIMQITERLIRKADAVRAAIGAHMKQKP